MGSWNATMENAEDPVAQPGSVAEIEAFGTAIELS
jgi:hypothetical protein